MNLIEIKDRHGQSLDSQWAPESLIEATDRYTAPELIGPTRMKRYIGLRLPPYHSVLIGFTVTSEAPTESQSFMTLGLSMGSKVEQIKLATIYEVVEANLDLWPKYIDFMNSHQLMLQSEEIRVSSDFGAPLTITSAKTGDKRVTVRLVEQDNNMTKAVVAYHPELTLFS